MRFSAVCTLSSAGERNSSVGAVTLGDVTCAQVYFIILYFIIFYQIIALLCGFYWENYPNLKKSCHENELSLLSNVYKDVNCVTDIRIKMERI